jgi:hypothetical protein
MNPIEEKKKQFFCANQKKKYKLVKKVKKILIKNYN